MTVGQKEKNDFLDKHLFWAYDSMIFWSLRPKAVYFLCLYPDRLFYRSSKKKLIAVLMKHLFNSTQHFFFHNSLRKELKK